MVKDKAMLPTNDYVFQRIFGHKGNEEITKGLLSSILKKDIKQVKLNENQILEKDLKDDKVGVLDIIAKLDDTEICNVEMQMTQKSNIEKRILFYWSKLYYSEIYSGEDYINLKKTIAILITNFEVDVIKDIPKYHTKWEIREEEYSKVILTDMLEIHIIDLLKLTKQLNEGIISAKDKVVLWAQFILNPDMLGEETMSENEDIKMAKEELDKIKQDERERRLAELRQKYIMDRRAENKYSYDKGKTKGREEGKKETKEEIVVNMYKKGFKISDICDITNLTKEEVEGIIKIEM